MTQLVRKATYSAFDPEDAVSYFYVLGHCALCSDPGIARAVETGPDECDELVQLYPQRLGQGHLKLPKIVDQSYKEAIGAAASGLWLATAVMVRRTLEAIGKQFKPNARTLHEGLKAMHDQGIISDELRRWGDQLRFLGNIGAHATEDVISPQDGRDAVEFLEAIAETIYHLRPRFQAMLERRQNGSTDADGASDEPS